MIKQQRVKLINVVIISSTTKTYFYFDHIFFLKVNNNNVKIFLFHTRHLSLIVHSTLAGDTLKKLNILKAIKPRTPFILQRKVRKRKAGKGCENSICGNSRSESRGARSQQAVFCLRMQHTCFQSYEQYLARGVSLEHTRNNIKYKKLCSGVELNRKFANITFNVYLKK